ncbi:hypothetical protein [Carbonactinospora thermoautotrophica]|uniref:Uncharacterized protein n=1 Tax=Carbonactinospora thermoautotrophica TaxID=1469144 RepID=A0A132MMA8_9ACTN|nr:hypothetical protein [Carbonactinospora thermoautotrophica]KWW98990.1 hypothetical protein LI90_621 [Carbonactinospora thermoautotrophica]
MAYRDPFGPLLPEQTSDDTDAGWGDREQDDLERLLRERPPHHGG